MVLPKREETAECSSQGKRKRRRGANGWGEKKRKPKEGKKGRKKSLRGAGSCNWHLLNIIAGGKRRISALDLRQEEKEAYPHEFFFTNQYGTGSEREKNKRIGNESDGGETKGCQKRPLMIS